jgi:hypothetical protein
MSSESQTIPVSSVGILKAIEKNLDMPGFAEWALTVSGKYRIEGMKKNAN